MRRSLLAVAATVAAIFSPAVAVQAQSALTAPDRIRSVPIVIPRGQVCFRHEGVGTHLTGQFRRGQRLIATSTGDAGQGDGRFEWETTQERGVSVNWGGDEDHHDFEGAEPFVAPVTGRYTFSYSPTSMLGGRGVFIVCAL